MHRNTLIGFLLLSCAPGLAFAAAAPPEEMKLLTDVLAPRAGSSMGGKFFQNQCGWMEGDEKVKCGEHALALDLRNDASLAANFEPGDGGMYRLTPAGREYLKAQAGGDAAPAVEPAAACKEEVGKRDGVQKKLMAQRALDVMVSSCMGDAGCAKDKTSQWLDKNCPGR